MTSSVEHTQNETDVCLSAMQLAMGSVVPMVLQTAVQLGIFDIIAKAGPSAKLSASDMAAQMKTHNQDAPIMVDRIARLLASQNLLACSLSPEFERLYSLSPLSYYFIPNQDGVSFAHGLALNNGQVFLDSWPHLKDAVLEGGIPFDRAHGRGLFEYIGLDDKFNQVFSSAMLNLSATVMKNLLESDYKGFEGIQHLVDVGGSLGLTLRNITSKYPHIKGINFDLPQVIQHAPSYPGVQHVAGDMFKSVPKGDAIFMKGVIHNWDDEQCLKLLKNCYEAIPENGKVIVLDSLVHIMAETTPMAKAAYTMDLLMMTHQHGGKERTKQDIIALAKKAGFNRINFDRVVFYCWVMEFYKN